VSTLFCARVVKGAARTTTAAKAEDSFFINFNFLRGGALIANQSVVLNSGGAAKNRDNRWRNLLRLSGAAG
jgi:hypothetical protein